MLIVHVLHTKCSNLRTIRQFDKVLRDDGLLSAEYFGVARNLLKNEYIVFHYHI